MNLYPVQVLSKKLITVSIHVTIALASVEFFGVLFGFSICTVLYFVLYKIIPKQLNTGIYFLSEKDYQNALDSFDKSIASFEKWKTLDKYGFVLLLNYSKHSYLEASLINKAAVLGKLDREKDAVILYQKILVNYPQNEIAQTQSKILQYQLRKSDGK